MNLFMIIPLFLVVTTGLWEQTMAQNTNTNGVMDTGSRHVMKRTTQGQAAEAPNTACTSGKEGQVYHKPANGSLIWICRSRQWTPHIILSPIGITSSLSAKSCKHIKSAHVNQTFGPLNGQYWIKVGDPCWGEQTVQTYCDMTTGGGGWSLVWKHSYLQVSPLTKDMFYNSSFYKPCTDLSVGWCNEQNKTRLQPEEMMIAAYHNGILVYAYKGTFNRNIDHHWSGATLLTPVTRIVDYCTRSGTGVPTPRQYYGDLTGLVFGKYSSGSDTIGGSLASPYDSRWSGCHLPRGLSSSSTGVQMTMAIYVR